MAAWWTGVILDGQSVQNIFLKIYRFIRALSNWTKWEYLLPH